MSLRSGYKSRGSWDSNRSVFNFEDEYGQDPILGRYGSSSASDELLSARAARSASEVQLAQASLDAAMRPAQVMSEFFSKMNSAVSQKADLEAKARGQAQAAQALERLGKVKDFASYTSILTEFPEATLDPRFKARWDAQGLSLQTKMLADFSNTLNAATTPDDIIRAQGSLPVEVLADPANRDRIDNLARAAEIRVKAQRAAQAAATISRATGTQESLDARMQYADVLSDPKVQAASEMAGRQSNAMRGLTQLGVEAMPVTQDGRFDIDRAENIVETLGQTDIRTLSAAQRGIQKQLEDPMLDPDGPDAKALQSDLTNINRQIAGITNRSNQQTTRATMDLESLGGTNPDWIDSLIDGGGGDAPAAPPVTTPGSAPTPEPSTPNSSAPVSSGGRSADAKNKQSGADASPKPFEATAQQLAAAELAYTRASQASPAPGVVPLSDQPPGIRQINEAVAYPYTEAREAKAKVSQLKKQLQPFENYDTGDPQDVQNAISIVYPEIDSKGSLQRKFDVGKSDDPKVAFAAEFLQRVEKENPGFVRRMAASPGPGGERGQLTLEEIPGLAAAADKFRKKRRSARGTKN